MSTLQIDFTPRVYLRDRTHTYLFLRKKKETGYFLTWEEGSVELVKVPLEEGEYRVYKRNEGEVDRKFSNLYHALIPHQEDPMRVAKIFWDSFLGKSPAAERELGFLLGIPQGPYEEPSGMNKRPPKGSAGYSLANICLELSIEPGAARRMLRAAGIPKPSERWEWNTSAEADKIRSLLRG